MSETAENLEITEETQPEITSELEQQTSQQQTPQEMFAAKQEELARSKGWKPQDEWVKEGHSPEDWVPAYYFNLKGEFIGKIKAKDREFEQRLNNVNELHQAQITAQLEQLNKERQEAMRQGGEEAVTRVGEIEQQMSTLSQAQPQQSNTALDEWNANNPWIKENTPKANHAKMVYGQALNMGATIENAIQMVEMQMKEHFSEQKPQNTGKVPPTEGGSRPGKAKSSPNGKLTSMNDLTAQEMKEVKPFMAKWDEKDILQAVQDARNAK